LFWNNCSNTTAIINDSRFVRLCSLIATGYDVTIMSTVLSQVFVWECQISLRPTTFGLKQLALTNHNFNPEKYLQAANLHLPWREIWRKTCFREIPSSTHFHNIFFNEFRHESTQFRAIIDISSNIVFCSTSVNHWQATVTRYDTTNPRR